MGALRPVTPPPMSGNNHNGQRLVQLWKRHSLVLLIFDVSLTLTAFFTVRMIVFTAHWSDPQNWDLAIED